MRGESLLESVWRRRRVKGLKFRRSRQACVEGGGGCLGKGLADASALEG